MKYSYETTVKFSEVGENGKLSLGGIVDYLQNCSTMQSESLGAGVSFLKNEHKAWIINCWQIEIAGDIRLADDIITSTWAYSFNAACAHRNFAISFKNNQENYVVQADSVWTILNLDTGKLERITEEDTGIYGSEEKLPIEYIKKKIVRGENYERQDEVVVRRYHLDTNCHMNNAWYIKIAEEFLKEEEHVTKLRVEYKNAAKLGDVIIPYVCYDTDRYVIELRNIEDKVYAVVEMMVKA